MPVDINIIMELEFVSRIDFWSQRDEYAVEVRQANRE